MFIDVFVQIKLSFQERDWRGRMVVWFIAGFEASSRGRSAADS
jgi:hypothetical protein